MNQDKKTQQGHTTVQQKRFMRKYKFVKRIPFTCTIRPQYRLTKAKNGIILSQKNFMFTDY